MYFRNTGILIFKKMKNYKRRILKYMQYFLIFTVVPNKFTFVSLTISKELKINNKSKDYYT